MSMRNSKLGKGYYNVVRRVIVSPLLHLGISPDLLTVAGLIFALLVPLSLYFSPLAGTIFLALSGIADSLDGQLAKSSSEAPSKFGGFLDSTVDRISDSLYLVGFWSLCWKEMAGFQLLILTIIYFFSLTFTLLFSYTKARIEGLGQTCEVGFMERAKRVIFLLIWGLLLSFSPHFHLILWAGIICYTLLVGISLLQRIRHARQVLL